MLRDGLNKYWEERKVDRPSLNDLFIWWLRMYDSPDDSIDEHVSAMANYSMSTECYRTYCETLPWEGNADLAGRGVRSAARH